MLGKLRHLFGKKQSPFDPINDLERSLQDAQNGCLPIDKLFDTFFRHQVFVLLEKQPDVKEAAVAAMSALMLKGMDGEMMLAVFTSPARTDGWPNRFPQFSYGLAVDFKWIVKTMGQDIGIVINPGSAVGLEMPARGVAQARASAALQ